MELPWLFWTQRLEQFQLFLALGTNSDELSKILDFCLSSEMQLGFRDLIL